LQLRANLFSQYGHIGLSTAKTVIGAHDFAYIEPFCINLAFTQDLNEQQGRHQFAVADQFVG